MRFLARFALTGALFVFAGCSSAPPQEEPPVEQRTCAGCGGAILDPDLTSCPQCESAASPGEPPARADEGAPGNSRNCPSCATTILDTSLSKCPECMGDL